VTGPLLCADAPALLYRAFFGLPDSITGAAGKPVNALLGSVNALLWCIQRYDPRVVVLCFGPESADYRVEAYPPYHANRPPMPDDLAWQWDRAAGLYEAFGWTVIDGGDLEADDVLGALAAAEEAAGGSALILTGDRDLFQCATDQVHVLMQQRGGDGPKELGPAEVREVYGIDPGSCPTSSPCAATRRTPSPAPRASARRPPRSSCAATARSTRRSRARCASARRCARR
jgi:DNA polymerase-1